METPRTATPSAFSIADTAPSTPTTFMSSVTANRLPPKDVVCLILGASTFLGSSVARELVRQERRVLAVDKQPCPFYPPAAIADHFVYADLRVATQCHRVFSVANEFAKAKNAKVWAFLFLEDMDTLGSLAVNEAALMLSNTAITVHTVEACLSNGVRRLFLASLPATHVAPNTSAVQGSPEGEPSPPVTQRDESATIVKHYAEDIAMRAAATSGGALAVRIGRFYNVYGPGGTWIGGFEKAPASSLRKALFLQQLDAAQPVNKISIEVMGSDSQVGSFCYIADAVEGVLMLMNSTVATPVHIASQEVVTAKELALLAGEAVGIHRAMLEPRLRFTAAPPGYYGPIVDSGTIEGQEFGWTPLVSLSDGLHRTADWLKSELQAIQTACAELAVDPEINARPVSFSVDLTEGAWLSFLHHGLSNHQSDKSEVRRIGLLLPVRSSANARSVLTDLRRFLASLRTSTAYNGPRAWQFHLIFGVEAGDMMFDPSTQPGAIDLPALVRTELPFAWTMGRVTARVRTFTYARGCAQASNVCRIWNDLASEAFAAGDDLVVLLGLIGGNSPDESTDDTDRDNTVELQAPGWPDRIWKSYQRIAERTGLPFGFGYVPFSGFETTPDGGAQLGVRSFPIVHRTHADVFGGRILPMSDSAPMSPVAHASANVACFLHHQHVDPFLYHVYRAFNATEGPSRVRLSHRLEQQAKEFGASTGGQRNPSLLADAGAQQRYVPWTGATLKHAREAAAHWLEFHRGGVLPQAGSSNRVVDVLPNSLPSELQPMAAPASQPSSASALQAQGGRMITMDVVVPTYRVPRKSLEGILSLRVPEGVSTQFIIVCDRPGHPEAMKVMEDLAFIHRDNPMVRLSVNKQNMGAGRTRNRGLTESAADWVVFLDDDVEPDPNLLCAYAEGIRKHPRATGFIGYSMLPPPKTARQAGVFHAGVAFFWDIAKVQPTETNLPWGVTANLCARRPPPGTVEFHETGGEDVAYCLRLREYFKRVEPDSEGFVACPEAMIHHPWWDGGVPKYEHFSGWAYGDGHLIDLFPDLTFRNLPDLAEVTLFLCCLGSLQLLVRLFGFLYMFIHGTPMGAMVTDAMARATGSVPTGATMPPGDVGAAAATAAGAVSGAASSIGDSIFSALATFSSDRALLLTLTIGVACIVGDIVYDFWVEFAARPMKYCAKLSFPLKVAGVLQGTLIRFISEAGRLWGHASRGVLLCNAMRRFNWYGYMWDGAQALERKFALQRTLCRAAFVAVGVGIFSVV